MFHAQLTRINQNVNGEWFDTVTISEAGTPVGTVMVASSEDPADYDQALAEAGYTDVTWLDSNL